MRFRVWRLGGFDSRSAVSRAALAALALWSSVPVQAAPPPGEAGCKVWNVQVGPSVFAIPYTPNLLAPPMVHVGDNSRASPWLREQVRARRCSRESLVARLFAVHRRFDTTAREAR